MASVVVDRAGGYADTGADVSRSGLVALRVDARQIEGLGALLEQAALQAPKAVAMALNRAADQTATAVKRALAKQTGLPVNYVGNALRVLGANPAALSAAIVATGGYVPLSKFKANQTAAGVTAAPWGKRRLFAHTFVIGKFGGNVFKRVGKSRLPLHRLYGPAIPRELPLDPSAATFYAVVPGFLATRLDHELGRLLSR